MSQGCKKIYQTHSHNLHFKMAELELTIERHEILLHKIHFKITGLVRRFSRRRNMSSSRMHCCYIILTKEYRKKVFVLSSSLKIPDPISS